MPPETREYDRRQCAVFHKTDEKFGGLSNMAGGFPLQVNGTVILTSEALYQACRFPHRPEVQRLIVEQKSPMAAKMKSKPFRKESRPDWDSIRLSVMRWSMRVKLAQNFDKFRDALLETEDRPIVEQSSRDAFWGAKPIDDSMLVGVNALGRLLMELRAAVHSEPRDRLITVEPLSLPEFHLFGEPIRTVTPVARRLSTDRAPPRQTGAPGTLWGDFADSAK